MKTLKFVLVAAFAPILGFAEPQIVSKDIGDPDMNGWKAGDWVTCGGDFFALDERPSDAPKGAKALHMEQHYAPRNFGGWSCEPLTKKLPGKPVRLECWGRLMTDSSWSGEFEFVDANTNKFHTAWESPEKDEKGNPKKIKWSTEWQKMVFVFPTEIKKDGQMIPIRYPIKCEGIAWNNWGDRNNPEAVTRGVDYYDLRLFTDMDGIAPNDRPYEFNAKFPVIANAFYYGEDKPQLKLAGSSWIGEEKTIVFKAVVESADGTKTDFKIPDMKMTDGNSMLVDLPCTEPGGYKVTISASGLPKPTEIKTRYVVCLKPRALTDQEKEDSPYGINVHGGGYVGYEKFARLGFVWLRDYAFTYGWMLNSRGDGKYAGWPWYPKICKAAEDVGMKTLPCLMGAVQVKKGSQDPNDPSFTPSNKWRRDMSDIVSTFENLSAFELDNETDGSMWTTMDGYGRYCQAFGDIIEVTRPDAKAVSPGLAGIYVEQTRELVEKGYFRNIDVVNGHRYCGKDGPEYSKLNLNTGMSEAKPAYLRDLWRHWKKAATCDGKFRELWVTEWGWDTLAGQPVSEWEQGAYLQRKWVLAMGNGVEKMFWYWYYDDDTDKPNYFFAGCGIFDRYRNPKPSAAAFAALRTFIPAKYEYVGTANLGPNHMVQIVKAEGKYVALAYKIRIDGPDLTIDDEKAEKVTDMFGKTLKPGKRKLDVAPTWYVGLDANSDWLKQCPIDLESDFYVRNVGGEPIKVLVTGADKFEYTVNPPKGWTAEKKPYGFDVTGPAGLGRGNTQFTVTGKNGAVSKTMPIDVDIVPQAYAKTKAAAFDGTFKINVTNQSAEDQDFTVKADLPAGWKLEPESQQTGMLAPEKTATLEFKIAESMPIDPAKKNVGNPRLAIVNSKGMQVDYAPIMPRSWTMHKIDFKKIKFDGDLSEWDERFRVNSFMIGPNGDKDPSRIYIAYCDEGLVAAIDVDDSKCFTADPGSFWRAADCFEIMLSTPVGAKFEEDAKWTVNDHQLWFCPILEKNNVFCGFWPNMKEQKVLKKPGTESEEKGWTGSAEGNVPYGSKSGLKKTERGYRAEIFVPASQLYGWESMKPGATAGLAFTLVVQDLKDSEHVLYWPNPKENNAMKKPWMWAKVKLAD